ncbi:hypothetical protein B0I35DRAFT_485392 [Stachybotrys elegans]|uniref:Uncharacterized protein n=1 Tax=Stachybotrys elegans TaxID=80388 RepID=A0A8K0S819_9HYPO|nr:hypothetical protein B0I35DRAFT_485392 [Stachybotrys elegans]
MSSQVLTSRWNFDSVSRFSTVASSLRHKHQFSIQQLELTPAFTTNDLVSMVKSRINEPDGPFGLRSQDQRDSIIKTVQEQANAQSSGARYGDLSILARDVATCLRRWLIRHDVQVKADSKELIDRWRKRFVDLIIDWSAALEDDPSNVYSLHCDLLPGDTPIHELAERFSYRSVIRFGDDIIRTQSSLPPIWTNHIFAVDHQKDYAYSYEEGYLRCHDTDTLLPVSEVRIGHKGLQQAQLSPDGTYIAMSFATSAEPLPRFVKKIQRGLFLQFRDSGALGLKWDMENVGYDITNVIGHHLWGRDFKLDHTLCLVHLNHGSPKKTNLFLKCPGNIPLTSKAGLHLLFGKSMSPDFLTSQKTPNIP